jgi:hypothetical protein
VVLERLLGVARVRVELPARNCETPSFGDLDLLRLDRGRSRGAAFFEASVSCRLM